MPALRLRGRLPSPFDCQRLFGTVNLVEDPGVRAGERLGSDPLDADAGSFLERFEGRKGGVKAALMSQDVLAGIGNTYSGEILLQAQLYPRASVAHLDARSSESSAQRCGGC